MEELSVAGGAESLRPAPLTDLTKQLRDISVLLQSPEISFNCKTMPIWKLRLWHGVFLFTAAHSVTQRHQHVYKISLKLAPI